MKQKALKLICGTAAFLLGAAFVAKFATPALLRMYVETGIGSCQNIPILCMAPDDKVITAAQVDKDCLSGLIPYSFPKVRLAVPRGFKVIQEEVKRHYYKRRGAAYSEAAVYVIYEEPGFFIGLYPQLKKVGISDNYRFLRHTMYADVNHIANLTDLFFIIMKGIFTPYLGRQQSVKMAQFRIGGKKGFINYNLRDDGRMPASYFDCNIIDEQDGFFKVYIKDQGARLGLSQALAIISTVEPNNHPLAENN